MTPIAPDMAAAVIGAAVDVALTKAISIFEEQFNLVRGYSDEIRKLRASLNMTRAFLEDADTRGVDSATGPLKVWFEQLRDTRCQAENILDELDAERRRRRVEKNQLKKVGNFFSPSKNPMAFNLKMAKKVRTINGSLDDLNRRANEFGLQQRVQSSTPPLTLTPTPTPTLAVVQRTNSLGESSSGVVEREANIAPKKRIFSNIKSRCKI